MKIADIEALKPFHWGFEFDEIINQKGGFDAIITNPPWEVFQTNEKEFFQEYESTIAKKRLRIEDWDKQRKQLMQDEEIRDAWFKYASNYPYQWDWFKKSSQYTNQVVIVDGKAIGNKPNTYCLFTEQCFNLLRDGGYCGIVIPSGIYTDLGTKQLREMLFSQTKVTGLFCFENRKGIFENVHSSFKFLVLTFEKGNCTESFPAAFMRHEVSELDRFPQEGATDIPVDLIRKLSPTSLSLPEFKSDREIDIAKCFQSVSLFNDPSNGWGIELYGEELNMTRSSKFFKTSKTANSVYEGGMIWHFDSHFSDSRYWVNEYDLRRPFLEKRAKRAGLPAAPKDMLNDYETYRLAIRKIASNTNERTLVSSIIPPGSFAGNSLSVNFPFCNSARNYNKLQVAASELLLLCSLLNSFVADYVLRARMTTNLNLFFLYQLPVLRLTEKDAAFWPVVKRAARLICTTPEFDDLAKEIGLKSHKEGATDPIERAKLRAELDGMIAHLYGLTEDEFAYILTTFPLVAQSTKDAALEAYRQFIPKTADEQVIALIAAGESATVEFKSSARWDMMEKLLNKGLEQVIIKTVAAFLNTDGGTLFIGVDDNGRPIGLTHDFQTFGKKQNRDGYENWLTTLLLDSLGKETSSLLHIAFHNVQDKELCVVTVKPSPKAIYVREGNAENFYIRTGNSTRQLTSREAVEYCKQRWQ